MKTLILYSVLIFFLGISIHSSSYAKVLPIIEGAELLDTLAAQNDEKVNPPDLSTGLYKNTWLLHLFYTSDKYLKDEMIYKKGWSLSNSSINRQFTFLLIINPDIEFRYIRQNRSQFNLVDI